MIAFFDKLVAIQHSNYERRAKAFRSALAKHAETLHFGAIWRILNMLLSRPLGWYWLTAIALLAWNVIGLVALLFDPVIGLGDVSKLTAVDKNYYAARPAAGFYGFVLATVAGTSGAIMLLMRRHFALWLFVASAIGLVLQNAWLLQDRKYLTAGYVAFQMLIAASIVLAIWLVVTARKRRWSR